MHSFKHSFIISASTVLNVFSLKQYIAVKYISVIFYAIKCEISQWYICILFVESLRMRKSRILLNDIFYGKGDWCLVACIVISVVNSIILSIASKYNNALLQHVWCSNIYNRLLLNRVQWRALNQSKSQLKPFLTHELRLSK